MLLPACRSDLSLSLFSKSICDVFKTLCGDNSQAVHTCFLRRPSALPCPIMPSDSLSFLVVCFPLIRSPRVSHNCQYLQHTAMAPEELVCGSLVHKRLNPLNLGFLILKSLKVPASSDSVSLCRAHRLWWGASGTLLKEVS